MGIYEELVARGLIAQVTNPCLTVRFLYRLMQCFHF